MIGVLDVGGGLRDIFGAGVFDYCIDHNIEFEYCLGISAGSANLVSYAAKQKGRNYVFFHDYPLRKEYMSLHNLMTQGSYLSLDYIYSDLTNEGGEYPLDYEALMASPKKILMQTVNAVTGETEYFDSKEMKKNQYDILKASSCVPLACKPVFIDGIPYYDGGLGNPIPFEKAFEDGCDKLVVILTKSKVPTENSKGEKFIIRKLRRRYPNICKLLKNRPSLYGEQMKRLKELEQEGKVLVLVPDDTSGLSTLTKDQEALDALYHEGYKKGALIQEFLNKRER